MPDFKTLLLADASDVTKAWSEEAREAALEARRVGAKGPQQKPTAAAPKNQAEAHALLTRQGWQRSGKTGDGADVYHSGYGRVFLDKEGFDHKDSGGIERGYGGHAQLGQYLKDLPSNTRMWQHESSR
jgi:hypothetical protein